jgi:hypothetical protein
MGNESTPVTKTTANVESSSKEGNEGGLTMAPPAFGLTANPIQRAEPDGGQTLEAEQSLEAEQTLEKTPEEALADLKALTGDPLKALLKLNTEAITAKGFFAEDIAAMSAMFAFKPEKKVFDEAMMEKVADWQYAAGTLPTGLVDDAFYGNAGVKAAVSKSRFDVNLQKSDTALASMITKCKAAVQKLLDDKKITGDDLTMMRTILANTPDLVTSGGKKHADVSLVVDGQLVKFIMQFQTENALLATGVMDENTFAVFLPKLTTAKAKLAEYGYTSMEGAVADLQTPVDPAEMESYLDTMIAAAPASNQILAQWLWMAAKLGFLTMGGRAKEDLLQLMSGTPFNRMTKGNKVAIDEDFATDGPLLNGLVMDKAVVLSYMTTWKADMTKPKQVLGLNSLATWDREGTPNQRRDGAHGDFKAMDYGVVGGEIAKFKGILAALPKGKYGLGIGIMSGFYHHPEYNASENKAGPHIDLQKAGMDANYGKVTDLDEVLAVLATPEALTTVPEIKGGTTLSDVERTNLKAAIKAYVDAKTSTPAKAPALLLALKTLISGLQTQRKGFNDGYTAEKAKVDQIIPLKVYGSQQLKINWLNWDKATRKWTYDYKADPTRVTSMGNEASFTQIMTQEVFDALKEWVATGQKLDSVYPDNPNHLHVDAKSV